MSASKGQNRRKAKNGFSLIEALAALALGTLLFGMIAQFTGAWTGRFRDVVINSSQQDAAMVVLDRMADDIQAAVLVPMPLAQNRLAFDGASDRLMFVRPAFGFDERPGLDQITYAIGTSGNERAMLRMRRDFGAADQPGEDLPLLRGDVRVRFGFVGRDGGIDASWAETDALPDAIIITIEATSPRPWVRSITTRLPSQWPQACGTPRYAPLCLELFP
jgi:general secretion pathway protein J